MSTLLNLSIVLACLSYPVTTVSLVRLGLPVGPSNITIKAVTASMFALVFAWAIRRRGEVPQAAWPLLAFLAIYSLRIIWDLAIAGVRLDGYSAGYVLVYFFVLTALPVTALLLAWRDLQVASLHRWMLVALGAANIALVVQVFSATAVELATLLSGRMQIAEKGEEVAVLSPLTFGFIGAATAAFCLARLCLYRDDGGWRRLALALLGCVGLVNMMLGASRGPIAGLTLAALLLAWRLLTTPRSATEPPRWWAGICLATPIALLLALAVTEIVPTFLFARILFFFQDRSSGVKEERDYQFEAAWKDFLESPLIGRHFVSSLDNFYPHNVALEVLMSTGLLGGLLFLLSIVVLLISSYRVLFRSGEARTVAIGLAAVCMLSSGMTSASIHSYPEFWIFFALMVILGRSGTPSSSIARSTASRP
jgi:hypothetical protein